MDMIHDYKPMSQYVAPLNSPLIDVSLWKSGIKLNLGNEDLSSLIEWIDYEIEYMKNEVGFTATITQATAEKYGAKYAEEQLLKIFMLAANEKAQDMGIVLSVNFVGYKPEDNGYIYAIVGWRGTEEKGN